MRSVVALKRFLFPLAQWLDDESVTDIILNRPGVLFIYRRGERERIEIPELTIEQLLYLGGLVGEYTGQTLSAQHHPILHAKVPSGERIQIVIPPACDEEQFGMAIRKPAQQVKMLDTLAAEGSFDRVWDRKDKVRQENPLSRLYAERDVVGFLRMGVALGKYILLGGSTGSGKTYHLNSIGLEIPLHIRIVTIEDTREIALPHENQINLMTLNGEESRGELNLSARQQVENAMRLKPDMIMVGEVRTREMARYLLEAAYTGHGGGISTIHADGAEEAYYRYASLLKKNPSKSLVNLVKERIPICVFFKETASGKREAVDIFYREAEASCQ